MKTPNDYIRSLGLQPHPEGGWFRETYRCGEAIARKALPGRYPGARSFATSIYFLLTSDTFSALHRLRSDEQWHFYTGSALTIHVIDPSGDYRAIRLGADVECGESFQAVVPAGCWFGATVDEPDGFTLVGCTVAPGFDFSDFEMGRREELIQNHPGHRGLIERLTRA